MKKVVRLTETELVSLIKNIISEQPIFRDSTGTKPPVPVKDDTSCLRGFKFVKSYHIPLPGPFFGLKKQKDGTVPDQWHGKYNGKDIHLFKDKTALFFPSDFKMQDCSWKCENGKLVVYNFGKTMDNLPT